MKRNFPSFTSKIEQFLALPVGKQDCKSASQDRGVSPIKLFAKLGAVLASLVLVTGFEGAIANPVEPTSSSDSVPASSSQEVDSSVSREYEPAIVYLPDPQTHQLVPQSVLITVEEPVTGAVEQIMQSYEGQDMGIEDYEVSIDASTQEAEINFEVNHPRGARAFESLSSSNQFALFEAIRETLLTQPSYSINEVIFLANGVSFDI